MKIRLLASLDGVTMEETYKWEHKLRNSALINSLKREEVPDKIWPQLEHQTIVTGIDTTILSVSDGGDEPYEYVYISHPDRRQRVLDGWKQFKIDLDNYKIEAVKSEPRLTGEVMQSLPALQVELTGAKIISTNLSEFEHQAFAAIDRIKKDPQTDQDFADAENGVKWLKDVEKQMDLAEEYALGKMTDVDAWFKSLRRVKKQARDRRLNLEKDIDEQKVQRKQVIIESGLRKFNEYLTYLNGSGLMKWASFTDFAPSAKFRDAVYGKKTIDSCVKAVDHALADLKIEVGNQYERIVDNVRLYEDSIRDFPEYAALFSDKTRLVTEPNFDAVIKSRISDFEKSKWQKEIQARAEKTGQNMPAPLEIISTVFEPEWKQEPDMEVITAFLEMKKYAPKTRSQLLKVLIEFEKFRLEY